MITSLYGKKICAWRHRLCQHALTDKLIASGACGTDRFRRSVIRVQRRVQLWQAPVPHHLSAAARIRQARKVRAAILWQKGWRRGKNQQILPPHPLNAASSAVGTGYASMYSLANRFSTPHAGLTASAISPFECALRRNACVTDRFYYPIIRMRSPHKMGEHLPPDKPTANFACKTDKLPIPPFGRRPSQKHTPGTHRACEHALSDQPIFSGACEVDRFYHSAIRVQRRVRNWQVSPFRHSGMPKGQVKTFLNKSSTQCRKFARPKAFDLFP